MKNKKCSEFIIIFVIIAAALGWFFKDAVFLSKIFVERDLSRYYYPLRYFAVNCVKSGIFPLWNPYIFCGNPLFATLQSSVLYPLSIVYYLGDFAKMFNLFILLHFFMAGVFTYIFLRQMRYSPLAGFLSAAAFALSGYLTSTVNLLTTLSVVAWFPLAMLFYYRMIRSARYGNHLGAGSSQGRSARSSGAPHSAKIFVPRLWRGPSHKNFRTPCCAASPSWLPNMWAIGLGVIFTVMFLAGEPSVLYMVMILFSVGSVYFTIEEYVERRGTARRAPTCYIMNMLLATLVFLGLSAFQLLPFWEFLKMSSRNMVDYHMAAMWNLPLKETPGIILPFFHDVFKIFADYWVRQSWLDNYYVGALVFFLFIIAVSFDRSKKARAIFIFGLIGFVIALGKDTALFEFLYRLMPGFKVMRYSIRFFFIPTFAICVLAGAGVDYYAKRAKDDPRLKKVAVFVLALAFFSSIAFWILHFNFQWCFDFVKSQAAKIVWLTSVPYLYAKDVISDPLFLKFIDVDLVNLKRAFFLMALFGSLFYFGTKKDVRAHIFIAPFLVFLAVADVFGVNEGFFPALDVKKFTAPTPNVEYLMKEYARQRATYPDDMNKQLFRICCSPQTAREHAYVPERDFYQGIEASKDRLITNRMVEFGIYDVNMYGSVYLRRNSRFMNLVMDRESKNLEKLLMLLGVKFVASPKEPKIAGFKLANKNDAANLYQTDKYLPRAFLAQKAVIITDEEKIIAKLREGDFDPANEVILEEYVSMPPTNPRPYTLDPRTEGLRITSYTPNRIVIEASVLGKPKFLVLTDTYYPGWKVSVDGKKEKLLAADYIFRAVYLEPGEHIITFIFSPFSFKFGVFLTLFSAIILTFIFIYNIIIWLNRNSR